MTVRQTLLAVMQNIAALLRTRVQLVAIEFAQERSRLLDAMLLGLGAFLFLLLGFLVFSVWLALLFWSTDYRLIAIAALAGLYLLTGLLLLLKLRNRLREGGAPFSVTTEVLTQDLEMLWAACSNSSEDGGDQRVTSRDSTEDTR